MISIVRLPRKQAISGNANRTKQIFEKERKKTMAKLKITGKALVYESAITTENLKKVQKYRPEILKILDDDKNEIFRVSISDDSEFGSTSKYGITFAGESTNGFAQVTELLCDVKDNLKDYLVDKIGNLYKFLDEIEERVPAALEKIEAEREAILSAVEFEEEE